MIENIAKVLAELVAAVFGVLGTYKDFSRERKSLRWKRITIGGIVVSSSMAIVIQNLEFINSQHENDERNRQFADTATKLEGLTQDASKNIDATALIQQGLKSTARDVQSQLAQQQLLAAGQKSVLKEQMEAVSASEAAVNPLDPVGVEIALSFPVSPGSCLDGYAEEVKSKVLAAGHKPDQHGTTDDRLGVGITWSANEEPSEIGMEQSSPLLPQSNDPAVGLTRIDAWLRFHAGSKKLDLASGITQADGAEYGVSPFAEDPNKELASWSGVVPQLRSKPTIDIYYGPSGKATEIDVDWTEVNVRKNNGSPSVRSVRDLPGTVLELAISSLGGCKIGNPNLDQFYFVWGVGYPFQSDFNESTFERHVISENKTSFTHTVTLKDLGF